MSASGFLVLDSASASSSVVANSDEEADGAQSPFVILHSPVQVNRHGRALPGGSSVPAAAHFGGLSPARTPSPHRNGTGNTINDAYGTGAQPQHPQPQRQPYDPTSSQFDPDSRRADSILHGGGVWADMSDVGDVDDAPVTGLTLPDPRTERGGAPPGTASTASTTGAAPGPSLGARTVAAVAPVRWSRGRAGSMGGDGGAVGPDDGAAGPDGAAAGRSSGIWAASASAAVAEAPPPPPPPPLPPDRAAAAAAEPAGAWDTLPADTRAMSSGNSSSRSRNTAGDNEGPGGEGMCEADGGGDEDDDAGGALGLLGGLDEATLRSIPPALLQLLQQLEEERDELAGRLLESDAELSALRASYQQLSQSHASSQTWLNQLLCQQLELHERRQRRRSRRQYSDQPASGAPEVVPAAAPAVGHVEEDGREEEPEEDVTGETGLEPEEEDIAAEGDLPTHGTATEGAAQQQQQTAVAAEDIESDDGGRAATAAAPRERELPPPLLSRAAVAADEAAVGEYSDSSGVIAGARASDDGAGEAGGALVAAARAAAPGVEHVAAVELAAAAGSGDSGRHGGAAEDSGSGRAGCGSPDRGGGRGVGGSAIVDSSCEGSAGAGADANEPPSASIASAAAVSPVEPAVEAQTELEAAAMAGAGAAAGAQPEAVARATEEEAEAEVSQAEAEAEAAARVTARPAARSAAAAARAAGWALEAVQEEEEGVAEEVADKVAEEEEPSLAHTANAASSGCGGLRQPQPQTVHQGQRQLRQRARGGHETETSGGESDLRSQPAAPERAGAALRPAGARAAPEPPPGRLPLPGLALGLVAVAAVVLLLLAAGSAVLLRGLSRESGFGASGRQLIPGSPHPVQAGHVAVPGEGQPAAALRGASAGPKLNTADNKADPNAATTAVRGAQGSLEPSGDDPAGAAHTAATGALAFGAGAEEPDHLGFALGTVVFYYQDPDQHQPQQQPELGQESNLSPSHGADAEATGQGEEQDQGQEQGVGRWHWPGLGEGAEALGATLAHGGQLQASLEPKALEVEVAGHGEGWPAPAGQPATAVAGQAVPASAAIAAAGAAASAAAGAAAAVAATATATATAAAGNVAADAASTCAGAADYVVADVATKVAVDSAAAVAALRATAATAAASAATPASAPAATAGTRAGARRNTHDARVVVGEAGATAGLHKAAAAAVPPPLPPLSTSALPPGLMAAIGPRAAPPPQPDCLALGRLSKALCYEAPGGIADPDLDPDVGSEHGRRLDRRQTRGSHRGGRRKAAASGDTAGGGTPDAACRSLAAARALPPGAVHPRAVAVRAAMVGLEDRWRRFAHEVTAAAAAAGTETHAREERRHRRRRHGGDADAGDANAASASASQVVASWAAAHWLPRLQRHVRSVADDDELPEAMATAHKVVALASRLCSETGYDLANLTAPLRQRLEAALGDMAAVTTVHVDAAYSGGAADVEAALAEAGRCLDWLAARTAEEEAVATCRRACNPRAQLLDALRQLGLPSSLLDRDLNLGRPDLNLGLDLGLDLDHHLDAVRSLLGPDSVLQKKLRNLDLDLHMDQHLDPYVSSLLGPDSALRKALRAGASLTDRLRDRIKPVVAGAAATAAAAVAEVRQVIEQQGSALACGCGTSGSRAAGAAAGAGFTNDTVAAQWCSRGLEALMKRARQAAAAVGDDPMAGDRRQERRRHDGDCQRQAREGGRRENKCDDTQSESVRRGASASAFASTSASAGGRQRDGEWAFEGLSAAVRQFRDDVAALRTAVAEVRRRCQGAAEGLKAYRQAMRQEL